MVGRTYTQNDSMKAWSVFYLCHCWTVGKMPAILFRHDRVNILRPGQNGRHFPDDILKWIILGENVRISIQISRKFVARGPINNIPTLVHIMAWHQPGDKPLSEPKMVSLLTHVYVTRPQWVNLSVTDVMTICYLLNANCGLVTSYGDIDLDQHWLRLWLVTWPGRAIAWTNIDLILMGFSGIHLRAISLRVSTALYNGFENYFKKTATSPRGQLVEEYKIRHNTPLSYRLWYVIFVAGGWWIQYMLNPHYF